MGKTYRRNGNFKPKQHGKVFDKKKSKWSSKNRDDKSIPSNDPDLDRV